MLAVVGLVAVNATPGVAQGTAVALRGGTLGPSVGVTTAINPRFNVRVDVPYFSYSQSSVQQVEDFDLEVEGSVRLFSVSGLVDMHPFRNGFRLSAGAVLNRNEATFSGRSAGPHTVGRTTYSAEEIGELSGTIELGSAIAPYLGIGFGNPVNAGKGLGLLLDLGIMFSGAPKVTMEGTGMVAPTAEEAPKVQDNLDWVRLYPAVSIGLSYKIF
jgi:hypothetical protein